MTLEREVKLGVWPGFSLPDLGDVAEGVHVADGGEQRLDATYHDTVDLRLVRRGITLRHRTGEPSGDRWTLKLPRTSTTVALDREEIEVAGDGTEVPDEIRQHVAAWIRTSPLRPVARLQTLRSTTVLRGDDGKQLAEVVDDEVSVLDGRHVALRFREVEVELAADVDEPLLDAVVTRLRSAGAGIPDPTPKVVRALGPRALDPPELVEESVGADASAAGVLRAGIARAVRRVLEHDAAVRLTDDVEAVHQARVGTRRLRSDLRTFAPLLDDHWAQPLRDELQWYADLLGGVRDGDVRTERLEAELARLDGDDEACGAPLVARSRAERDDARIALVASMRTDRHARLLDALVDAARDPRVLPKAADRAADVLPALVARPWRQLAKAVKQAGADPEDAVLHRIRIRAKRARYAADVAAIVVGKRAARFAEAVAGVQEVLGEHQDACVREAWLRRVAAELPAEAAMVAGELVAMARADAARTRAAWPRAWQEANEGRLRSWLTR